MRAGVDDPSMVEDDDEVCAADRRQAVGDDERGPAGEEPTQSAVDPALRADVDRRRRLVEDEDARVCEEGSRECDELPLAERELEAALADLRVVAGGEIGDERVGSDGVRGRFDLGAGGAGPAEGDVVGDRACEEEALLRNDPELAAERLLGDAAQVGAVDRDPPVARVVEAREQLGDRGLSRAGVPDERDRRARRDVEVEVVQDVREVAVAEADVVEADVAFDAGELDARPASRRCPAPRRERR